MSKIIGKGDPVPHTPGPWTIGKYDCYDKGISIPQPKVEIDFDDVNHGEQEANARLIAAAPEMFETLKRLVKEAAQWEDGEGITIGTIEDAQAAIDSVEGGKRG